MSNPHFPYPPPAASSPSHTTYAPLSATARETTEPTIRSRTLFYLSIRDSTTFAGHGRNKRAERDYGQNILLDDGGEEQRLIGGREGWNEVGIKELPPRWVDTSEEIEEILNRTRLKSMSITALDKLHSKHVLPGFTDRSAEEREIESRTVDITHDFRQCSSLISAIQPETHTSRTQRIAVKNVQRGLAQKIQELSEQFRKKQRVYMQKLQGHAIKNKDLMVASGAMTLKGSDVLDELAEDEQVSSQFQSQIQVHSSSKMGVDLNQRAKEIDQIATSISELAELFRDLGNIVVEQGTLLDSVEYNVSMATRQIQAGEKELVTASKYQARSGKRKCIFFLILCIVAMILVIIFAPGNGSSSSSPSEAAEDGISRPSPSINAAIVKPSAIGGRYLFKPRPLRTDPIR
nr:hypothetical protein L204_00652 [Cryptococcus depauperatus CBS 7855]